MLVDRQKSVSLRLTDSAERADLETRHGLRRLVVLTESRRLDEQVHWLPGLDEMLLHAASIRPLDLRRELVELVADRAYLECPHPNPLPKGEGTASQVVGWDKRSAVHQKQGRMSKTK